MSFFPLQDLASTALQLRADCVFLHPLASAIAYDPPAWMKSDPAPCKR